MKINYLNGWKQGKAVSYYRDGKVFAHAFYDKGNFSDKTKAFFPNGALASQNDTLSRYKGDYTLFYANGKTCSQVRSKGHKYSQSTWYANGIKEKEYTQGEKQYTTTWWFSNGQKRGSETYANDKCNGIHKFWHSNGQEKEMTTFSKGQRQGSFAKWAYNGWLLEEGSYNNDKKSGLWKSYEFGKVDEEKKY